MNEWVFFLAAVTALSATGFVVIAVLWMRKLRQTVSAALGEAALQQVRASQRFSEAVGQIQKRQRALEEQILALAQASAKLRQDVAVVASRVETSEREYRSLPLDRTVH